jgi:hypothetical protein
LVTTQKKKTTMVLKNIQHHFLRMQNFKLEIAVLWKTVFQILHFWILERWEIFQVLYSQRTKKQWVEW